MEVQPRQICPNRLTQSGSQDKSEWKVLYSGSRERSCTPVLVATVQRWVSGSEDLWINTCGASRQLCAVSEQQELSGRSFVARASLSPNISWAGSLSSIYTCSLLRWVRPGDNSGIDDGLKWSVVLGDVLEIHEYANPDILKITSITFLGKVKIVCI